MPQHLDARLEGPLWQGPVRRLWDRSKGEESFDAYTAVADALAEDDLARTAAATGTAQKALETVDMKLLTGPAHVAWMKQLSDLRTALEKMQPAGEIGKSRAEFEGLSKAMEKAVKRFGVGSGKPVHKIHCPMAFNHRGADFPSAVRS